MIKERRGLAAVFDAMIFLAIVSVVAVTLLSTISPPPAGNGVEVDVEAVHNVLLRSTVTTGPGNNLTVQEAAVTSSCIDDNRNCIQQRMAFLLPGRSWRWTVDHDGAHMVLGTPVVPEGVDVHCSIVRFDLPDGELSCRLDVWRA
jgi:hypothetical protein